jgi:zinc D-Ala-D-Ala dipeptidase
MASGIPDCFVDVCSLDPSIIPNLRYAGTDNFVGRPAPGYTDAACPRVWLTREAATALVRVSSILKGDGYQLVVYDSFRPTRAVAFWCAWAEVAGDDAKKAQYYPRLPTKADLFNRGYVARRSGHSRGSTVDVSIIRAGATLLPGPLKAVERPLCGPDAGATVPFLDDGTEDMYTSWDLLDVASHHDTPLIPPEHLARRNYLRRVMTACGWIGTPTEWWHWTLKPEPYPSTFFDCEAL